MRNPVDNISRLHKPKRTPDALSPAQVNAIRAVIKVWEQTRGTCGPNPDSQLGQIVEVMLATSARIGEVLAIRRCDVDVTTAPPKLRIAARWCPIRACHSTTAAPEDRPLQPGDRPTDVHHRGSVATPRCHGRPVTGGVGLPESRGDATDDGSTSRPVSTLPRSCSATPIRRSLSSTTSDVTSR